MASISGNNAGMLTALFSDRDSAERAYQVLSERGYSKDDITVIMSDDTRKKHFAGQGAKTSEIGNKAAEGAGVGGAVGGTLGAILAAATATGASLALPGLGLVIAGPLAAAAAGAGAGAATGGLLGALVGWGIPEEHVKRYESGLKGGGILIGVRPRSAQDADEIAQRWRSLNARDIYRPDSMAQEQAPADMRDTVVGVYDDYADAEGAMQALTAEGFSRSAIHIAPENASESVQPTTVNTGEQHGAAGITNFFRSLFGVEHHEHHEVYAESVRRGSYVLTVDTQNDEEIDRATDIMGRFNPVDIDERSSAWRQQGWSAGTVPSQPVRQESEPDVRATQASARAQPGTQETSRIPVIEEELKIGKRVVQRGGVRVFRRVSEKPVHESVQLREEHVKVERHAVDKPASEADLTAFREGSVEMREMAEEPVVAKTAHVVEEVVVGKEVTQKTAEINETVRKTDVEVEQLGASDVDAWRHHRVPTASRAGATRTTMRHIATARPWPAPSASGTIAGKMWNRTSAAIGSDSIRKAPGTRSRMRCAMAPKTRLVAVIERRCGRAFQRVSARVVAPAAFPCRIPLAGAAGLP